MKWMRANAHADGFQVPAMVVVAVYILVAVIKQVNLLPLNMGKQRSSVNLFQKGGNHYGKDYFFSPRIAGRYSQ
jgi:hypothetical protein